VRWTLVMNGCHKVLVFLASLNVFKVAAQFRAASAGNIGGVPVYNWAFQQSSMHTRQRWLLIAKPTASDATIKRICKGYGAHDCVAEGHPDEGGLGFSSIKASYKELESVVLRNQRDIEFLEPLMPIRTFPVNYIHDNSSEDASDIEVHDDVTNTSLLEGPTDRWGLDRIDSSGKLDGKYTPSNGGKGVHVYVLDTGIRTTHEDFEGRAIPTLDSTMGKVKVCNPRDHRCAQDTDFGHGTHCAGIIGGKRSGVAKQATLHSCKVLGRFGGNNLDIIAAMDWILQHGKRPAIMSMSLGGPGQSQAFRSAVDRAVDKGITVVVAAGNFDSDACRFSPAFVPKALTVGAIDITDKRADFSNSGRCIDLWAPGVDILSTFNANDRSYKKMKGTSMACPHVAGAAALEIGARLSLGARLSPARIISLLKGKARRNSVRDAGTGSPNLSLYIGSPTNSGGDGRSGGGRLLPPGGGGRSGGGRLLPPIGGGRSGSGRLGPPPGQRPPVATRAPPRTTQPPPPSPGRPGKGDGKGAPKKPEPPADTPPGARRRVLGTPRTPTTRRRSPRRRAGAARRRRRGKSKSTTRRRKGKSGRRRKR